MNSWAIYKSKSFGHALLQAKQVVMVAKRGGDKGTKGGRGAPSEITPPPRGDAPTEKSSAPKVARRSKSPGTRTLHYSPGDEKKTKNPPKVKLTAVKAKAKSAPPPKPKSKAKAPAKPVKVENPVSGDPKDVKAALARKTTAEIDRAASPSSSSEDAQAEPEDREMTEAEVVARKAAHARYMRFSRSLKSKSFLVATISNFKTLVMGLVLGPGSCDRIHCGKV